jgi:hypothetical protein
VAFLIPDNLASRKDVPEAIRRVARALAVAADDDVIVWYEPLFDPSGRHPHLVVLEPRLGVVVLEVLKAEAAAADDPLVRADRLAATLRTALDDHPTLAGVPVGAAAVLSGVDRAGAERRGLDGRLDLDVCLFPADLDAAIADGAAGRLLRPLSRAMGTPLAEELSDRQVAELRGVIHPDVLITGPAPSARESPAGARSPNVAGALFIAGTGPGGGAGGDVGDDGAGGEAVNVLDRRQEAFAKSLGHGHRVIRGVAGSGKTLVLVHRARLLARLRPGERILVTCFTRSLASMLRAQLAELPDVEVVNLDRLMKQAIDGAGLRHPGYGRGAGPVAEAALDAVRRTGRPRYRAVLIDEAQDFDTEALRFCVELLDASQPDGQDLVVVADSAQNIFRKSFRWKDAGIRAQGRTRVLRVNYRNTREILEFAHRFLTADPAISVDEVPDPEDELSIIPAESAERSGPAPTVVVADDAEDEVRRVVEAVRQRWSPGMASRSIAVLHGDAQRDQAFRPARLLAALRAAAIPAFWVTDPQQRANRDRAGSAGAAVVVSTIHSAKGLEFPEVVVCGLGARDDLTTARKLLYVGFTRAVDRLSVVVGASSPFHDDVLRSCARSTPPVACKVFDGSAVKGGDGDDLGERVEGDGDELPDAGRAVP